MNSHSEVKQFILNNIPFHQKYIIYIAINQFGISRQAVLKHMNTLIADQKVKAYGKTRNREYRLIPQVNFKKIFQINDCINSNENIQNEILMHLKQLSKNIFQICEYSIGALINNIFEYVNSSSLYVKLFLTYSDNYLNSKSCEKSIFVISII